MNHNLLVFVLYMKLISHSIRFYTNVVINESNYHHYQLDLNNDIYLSQIWYAWVLKASKVYSVSYMQPNLMYTVNIILDFVTV